MKTLNGDQKFYLFIYLLYKIDEGGDDYDEDDDYDYEYDEDEEEDDDEDENNEEEDEKADLSKETEKLTLNSK